MQHYDANDPYGTYDSTSASQGGPQEDSRPTESRLRAAANCRRAWPVAVDSSQDHQECAGVREAPNYAEIITTVCDELKTFLVEKNKSYGASAFVPAGVFSKLTAREQILVRIDDKLSRIREGNSYPGDDNIKDLTGYLILLMVSDLIGAAT